MVYDFTLCARVSPVCIDAYLRASMRAYLRKQGRTLRALSTLFRNTRVNLRPRGPTTTRFSRDNDIDNTTTYVLGARVATARTTSRGSRYVLLSLSLFSSPLVPRLPLAVSLCAGWPAYDVAWYGAISPFAVRVIPEPIDRDLEDIPCFHRSAPCHEATVSEMTIRDTGVRNSFPRTEKSQQVERSRSYGCRWAAPRGALAN